MVSKQTLDFPSVSLGSTTGITTGGFTITATTPIFVVCDTVQCDIDLVSANNDAVVLSLQTDTHSFWTL